MKAHRVAPRWAAHLVWIALSLTSAWGWPMSVSAEIPTFRIARTTSLSVADHAEVLADPDDRADPRAMLSPETRFDSPLGVHPNFGIDPTPRWYRFALTNDCETAAQIYFDVGYTGLDRVVLHYVEDGELISEVTGNALPFTARPIRFPTFLFRVTLEPGETRVFAFEIQSSSVHSVSIAVSGQDAFIDKSRREFLGKGAFFGMLFLLTMRRAIAFFTRRRREELWYVLQSVAAGLYVSSLMGSLYGRWPEAVDFNRAAPTLLIGAAIFFTGRFGVAYLGTRGKLRAVVDVASYVVLAFTLLSPVLPFGAVVGTYFAGVVTLGSILLGSAVERANAGSRPAAVYFVAWAPIFVVGWVFGLGALGLLPVFHLGPYMIGASLLWERTIVSLGLELRVAEAMKNELQLREEALVAAEERRKLEIERQRGRRLESLGRLAGGIAHDFNNLLQAIGGFIHIVRRREELSARGAEMLEQANRAVQRAAELTGKLLVLGRNTPAETSKTLEVDETLRSLEELLLRVLPSDVTLRLDLRAQGAAIACDRAQFELCITNLCLNARDAMPKGGEIGIVTRADDAHVEIVVEDTGEGIPKEHLDRIFEPFFTTKAIGEGTGLGLVMVHGIVTSAGGTLEVESEVGKGTRFSLRFPAVTAEARALAAAKDTAVVGGNERILLVDDTDAVREVGASILRDAGYEVVSASGGLEAIEIIQRSPSFDLFILDVVMPRMGGAELYEWLLKERPGVPVLICTAYRPDEAAIRLDRAQLTLLGKPYEPEELLRTVRSLLDVRSGCAPAPPSPRRA